MNPQAKVIIVIILILAILWGVYWGIGRPLLEKIYSGKSLSVLNNIIGGQDLHSLTHYYSVCDSLLMQFLFAGFFIIFLNLLYLILPIKILSNLCKYFKVALDYLQTRRVFILILCLLSLLLIVSISNIVLLNFLNSGDEHAYVFQAKIFARGKLWVKPHCHQEFFSCWFISSKDGKLFSQVPPGWPIVLTLFELLDFPSWSANPLLGMLTIYMMYLAGKQLFDKQTGILASLTLAISPYFVFTSSSYFSHTLCALLLLLLLYFAVRSIREDRLIFGFLAGIFFGWAFITRFYSAVLCMVPISLYVLVHIKNRKKVIGGLCLGILIFIILQLAYNFKITGNALLLPYKYIDPNEGLGFVKGHTLMLGVENAFEMIKSLLWWTPITLLLIYTILFFKHPKNWSWYLIKYQLIFLVIGHIFYWSDGGNSYGPRYCYEAYPFLVLTVAAYIVKSISGKKGNNYVFYLYFAGLLILPYQYVKIIKTEGLIVRERMSLYNEVERRGIENAVVFLGSGTGIKRPMGLIDLTRNSIDFSNNVIYVKDLDDKNIVLMKYYPERQYFKYGPNKNGGEKKLVKISYE